MTPREYGLNVLKFTRHMSNEIMKGWPENKWTFQNSPADNHPLWVMGHMVGTDAWTASLLGITYKSPDGFDALFGSKSKPTSDPKAYPQAAEVRKAYEASRAALIAWYEKAPESALATPLKDKTGGFFNDPVDALFKLSWHEGWHFGQVATLRKSLGLPPIM